MPFFAIIIWSVIEFNYIRMLQAPDCLGKWTEFIEEMETDCSRMNLRNLLLMLCLVSLRIFYLLVLKDKEVLDAIFIRRQQ